MTRISALLLTLLMLSATIQAQEHDRTKARRSEYPPKALLVMLPTYQNRVHHFDAAKDYANLARLEKDRIGVWKSMLTDFGSYFSYCPLYFFVDTNLSRVLVRDFDGVLLDSSLHPVRQVAFSNTDTNFMIACYRYRDRQKDRLVLEKNGSYVLHMFDGDTEAQQERLVLHDYRMEQLQRPAPREPVMRKGMYTRAELSTIYPGIRRYRLRYRSSKFNIQYQASAGITSLVLRKYYGPYPYSKL